MNEFFYILISVTLIFFTFLINPWIGKKYSESKYPINMMIFAVTFTLVLASIIEIVASGEMPIAGFVIILPTILGAFIVYGLKHRNEVKGKMRKTYTSLLIGYSYVFTATGFMMLWFLPFMPNITI